MINVFTTTVSTKVPPKSRTLNKGLYASHLLGSDPKGESRAWKNGTGKVGKPTQGLALQEDQPWGHLGLDSVEKSLTHCLVLFRLCRE